MVKKYYKKIIKLLIEFGKLLELKKIDKINKDQNDEQIN